MDQPSLPCRILKLIPGDYELRDVPLEALPPDTYFEDALVQLDSGEEVWIFDPSWIFNPSIARSYVGRRCLLELSAAFGDCELITEQDWLKEQGISDRKAAGKISSYYRDGVVLDMRFGSIGVRECIDDRLEPGRFMQVSNFRLDFNRLIAVGAEDQPGLWSPVDEGPFPDPPQALLALRAGETETPLCPRNRVRPGNESD
jgi:hypothetical protein